MLAFNQVEVHEWDLHLDLSKEGVVEVARLHEISYNSWMTSHTLEHLIDLISVRLRLASRRGLLQSFYLSVVALLIDLIVVSDNLVVVGWTICDTGRLSLPRS